MKDLTNLRKIATLYPKDRVVDGETVLDLITRLEQAEAAVARVREVATGDPAEYGWSEAMLAVLRALDGDQA